jgi:hypothetical protein
MTNRFFLVALFALAASACGSSSVAPTPVVNPSQPVTVSVPLEITNSLAVIARSRMGAGYLVVGTIAVTLNHAIGAPVPSTVRAEWENSLIGATTDYPAGATELNLTVTQDTVACPNLTNSPTDYLRLVDVARQVVLARVKYVWNANMGCS